jgi:hypothetical protein
VTLLNTNETDTESEEDSPRPRGRSVGAFCERRPSGIRIGVQETPVNEPGFRASNILPEDDAELFVSQLIDELDLWGKYGVPSANADSRVVIEDDSMTEEDAKEIAEHIRDTTNLEDEMIHIE